MQVIKRQIALLIFLLPIFAYSQSAYLPQGAKELPLIERLEILSGGDSALSFSHIRPISRKSMVRAVERLSAPAALPGLSSVDRYNMERVRFNNLEWVEGDKSIYRSKKPVWNSFFKTPANMIEVDRPDFFLSVNPILQLNYIYDDQSDERHFVNTRGFVARAVVAKKFSFQTYLTENQERAPLFVRQWIDRYRAVPGVGFYKPFKVTAEDYLDARASVVFNAAKFLDVQFGYDRAFLGNGYRSLFLSDFSNNHLFLNLNLRVWKLNYASRVMELTSQYDRGIRGDTVYPKKYMAIHHVSFNAPKWLTLTLFEGVVFGRANQFEFGYLNPVIFLRPMEHQVGSNDNAFIGLEGKANVARRFQLYGQILLDEFNLAELKKEGSWVNKWAIQAGLKHVDLFGVKNLDLQLEANIIRPFTYTHRDSVANYTHYNQPLAHPLMANVREFVGILRYQPANKWHAKARVNYWLGGTDINGQNWGNNIFLPYTTRAADYGNVFGAASTSKWMNANLWVGYEWKENLFLEFNAYARKSPDVDMNIFGSVGLRWNMHRREYDY